MPVAGRLTVIKSSSESSEPESLRTDFALENRRGQVESLPRAAQPEGFEHYQQMPGLFQGFRKNLESIDYAIYPLPYFPGEGSDSGPE